MATIYTFFKFDHKKVKDWERHIKLIKESDPFYMLTRFRGEWEMRIPAVKNHKIDFVTYDSLGMYEIFKTKGFRRPRKLTDLLTLVQDLRVVWGDYPLHVRIGHHPNGLITQDITGEDELIIQLKYMDIAC